MRVLKFGGSSVADAARIANVTAMIARRVRRGEKLAVVFSAFGGDTDRLIYMANAASGGNERYRLMLDNFHSRHREIMHELFGKTYPQIQQRLKSLDENLHDVLHGVFLLKELSDRSLDYIQSFGERYANFIIKEVFRKKRIKANYVDARQLILTDDHFRSARVMLDKSYRNIRKHFKTAEGIQVITGFIGSTTEGATTTLGRGGSDYTAALIGAALKAELVEIWTDVDGVMTANPSKINSAFAIPHLTYEEAMELSHFGAKVIYPPTMQPAMDRNVGIQIRNTFEPEATGTLIDSNSRKEGNPVKGISSIDRISLLTLKGSGLIGVTGTASRLFGALAEKQVNIILITQGSSEHTISLAVAPQDARRAKEAIEAAFRLEIMTGYVDEVILEEELSIIAVIGERMRSTPGISGRLYESLGKNGINVIASAQGSSELNISVVIPARDEVKALNVVHTAFFLSEIKPVHLFVIGTGLIGSTLLRQLEKQAAYLKRSQSLEIRVMGLSNSRRMVVNPDGINLSAWEKSLSASRKKADLEVFVSEMCRLNLPNSIFVDNTSSEAVIPYYEKILESSISISTPNKLAASGTLASFKKLKAVALKRNVKFLFETNVGAGLPVITTLNDLINSGDRIVQIEAVLSGSLSYIFNNFTGTRTFAEVVEEAKLKGLTEPDPRTDLSGMDVARKLLILARESGLDLESKDINVENILPRACQEAPNVDSFMKALAKENDYFDKLKSQAAKGGRLLRYIATLDNASASVSLKNVGEEHPFYHLSGSDNMIVFHTERYKERPLVIRGPGAGAEVTAAGVFAEIISIANYLGA